MQPGSEAEDVPGRSDLVNVFQSLDRPMPATAVRAVTPERERRTTRPDCATVYLPAPSPEMQYFARCFAYAYIAPAGAACKADPEPFIRRAIHGVVPRALFELLGPGHGADRTVRFRSPDDREAAMEKQPFALDGASVRLVREGETSNVRRVRLDCVAHVALLRYPKEQRNLEDIRRNCTSFGHLLDVDAACYDAPDLSPVRVVVNMEHPREIPREVRIRYSSDLRFRHVLPVQILRIWDMCPSTLLRRSSHD
jgi:hypothetical protein